MHGTVGNWHLGCVDNKTGASCQCHTLLTFLLGGILLVPVPGAPINTHTYAFNVNLLHSVPCELLG